MPVKVYTYETIVPLNEEEHPKTRVIRRMHGQVDDWRWCCQPGDLEPIEGMRERERVGRQNMLIYAQCRWCGQPHKLEEWRDPVGESDWGYKPCVLPVRVSAEDNLPCITESETGVSAPEPSSHGSHQSDPNDPTKHFFEPQFPGGVLCKHCRRTRTEHPLTVELFDSLNKAKRDMERMVRQETYSSPDWGPSSHINPHACPQCVIGTLRYESGPMRSGFRCDCCGHERPHL